MRIVIDPHRAAVFETHACRALDLREQQIRLTLQPDDFEPTPGDGAILDLAAIVVGHELATTDLAKYVAAIRHARGGLVVAAHEQIRRAAIYRHRIDIGFGPRTIDHRLIITG